MLKPISVRALPNYRIEVGFSDGTKGSVDLSELVGKGVFEVWNDEKFFAQVHLGPGRQIRFPRPVVANPALTLPHSRAASPLDLPWVSHNASVKFSS